MDLKKEIWIATTGEPIPGDAVNTRLLRSCQFAIWLSEKGHKVTFLTNSVDHFARSQRCNETTEIQYSENLKIVLLWTRSYTKSVSIRRFMSHRDIVFSFKRWQKSLLSKPDVIVSAYPTFEICEVLSNYAQNEKIPIFFDCRDAWPDIFSELLPRPIRFAARAYRILQDWRVRTLFNSATGLLAVSSEFLDWALYKAARERRASDAVFHFTYPGIDAVTTPNTRNPANPINVIFAGTLTKRNDLEAYLPAFKKGENLVQGAKLTIAGTGEDEERLRQICSKHDYNVEFLGWQDVQELKCHFEQAHFGLLPYMRDDFKLGIPNKFPEYVAHSLPVICISESVCGSMVANYNCGIALEGERNQIHAELFENLSSLDQNLVNNMSKNAAKLFEQNFKKDNVFSMIEKHIVESNQANLIAEKA